MTQKHQPTDAWGAPLPDELQALLREEPPLPPELVEDIWSGTQKKIAAGVVVAGALAIATAAAKTTAPTSAGLFALTASTVVKVVVGSVLVVSAVGGAIAVTRSASTTVAGPVVVAAPRVAPKTEAPVAVAAPIALPVAAPVAAPPRTALPKPNDVVPPPQARAAPEPHTVKAELLLLDQARAALDRGDADAALVAIAKQRALSGAHGKDEEAAALEVMATARVDVPRAKKLRDRFVWHYPDSKLQQRVDRSVGE